MSRPTTLEQKLLFSARTILQAFSKNHKEQMLVIEMSAALNGGFNIDEYWNSFGVSVSEPEYSRVFHYAELLRSEINKTDIPFPVALSSLSREPIPVSEQKKKGAFYTDYRLSEIASSICADSIKRETSIADIAAGSGILLSSVASLYHKSFSKSYNNWIADNVYAFDLSADALRGAMASLASLSNSVASIVKMRSKWRIVDSLTTDQLSGFTFDIVIGNPPWGKVKLTRHQFSLEQGFSHDYGSEYENLDESSFCQEKAVRDAYSRLLRERYSLLGNSDTDVYVAFLQKSLSLLAPGGKLVYIVPAGLIRSQGTASIRRYITSHYSGIEIALFDNKASYFSIDTRFKFLIISLINSTDYQHTISIHNYKGDYRPGYEPDGIGISIAELQKYREDLSIPEVSSVAELELFYRICANGSRDLFPEMLFSRELDMTNDKSSFVSALSSNIGFPVIEGRMVQPYRVGAKRYISGSGRKALWKPSADGIFPQYRIMPDNVSISVTERVANKRIGYCDIAGQTNERSMMAAVIPENVICGNKVPTVLFGGDNAEDRMYLWLGIVNSFVFDWLLRRILTTTVNYFLLQSLPLPRIDIHSQESCEIINKAKLLTELGEEYYKSDLMGDYRAALDVLVAKAYGLQFNDLLLILNDFPLIDRGQVSENNSLSITKALVMSFAEYYFKGEYGEFSRLANRLREKGAKPYILYEMRELC